MIKIPLYQITDEHAIQAANLAWVGMKITWVITRRDPKRGVWMDGEGSCGIKYYFRLNEYGCIYSSTIFPPEKDETKPKVIEHNIGGAVCNINDGVPYILILDFLRYCGYDLPYSYSQHDLVNPRMTELENALIEIQSMLPANPSLALTRQIKDIVDAIKLPVIYE